MGCKGDGGGEQRASKARNSQKQGTGFLIWLGYVGAARMYANIKTTIH